MNIKLQTQKKFETAIQTLEKQSQTFKTWWNKPGKFEGLSKKEQFKNILDKASPKLYDQLSKLAENLNKSLIARKVKVVNQGLGQESTVPLKEAPKTTLADCVKDISLILEQNKLLSPQIMSDFAKKPLSKPPKTFEQTLSELKKRHETDLLNPTKENQKSVHKDANALWYIHYSLQNGYGDTLTGLIESSYHERFHGIPQRLKPDMEDYARETKELLKAYGLPNQEKDYNYETALLRTEKVYAQLKKQEEALETQLGKL